MEYEKFADYLQQVLALPAAVFEAPTFGFSEAALTQCFKRVSSLLLCVVSYLNNKIFWVLF